MLLVEKKAGSPLISLFYLNFNLAKWTRSFLCLLIVNDTLFKIFILHFMKYISRGLCLGKIFRKNILYNR